MASKIPFSLVCIIGVLGGILVIGLQIVSASTRAWVEVISTKTYRFGLFRLEDTRNLLTLTMIRSTPLVVMQAMFVLSIGFGLTGITTTVLAMTQRIICGKGTKFFITLSQVFFAASAILYLVGLATFTHSWLSSPSKFFQLVPAGAAFAYGYAYTISWLVVILHFSLVLFLIVTVNIVIRRQDRQLVAAEEIAEEHKKLLDKTESSVEKADVDGINESGGDAASSSDAAGTATPQ